VLEMTHVSAGACFGGLVRDEQSLLPVLQEELQVNLKHRLKKPHIGSLVQPDLVLPDVDDQYLASGQCEEGALALKILVFAALATVGALNIHYQYVIRHLLVRVPSLSLVLGHPDALGGLPAFGLGHDAELGAEEVVEQGGLSGRLRAEDGDEVVVEACLGHVCFLEVCIDVGAAAVVSAARITLFVVFCDARSKG
jgi:hypothetical protein